MIIACLDDRFAGRTFDISGLEQMTYLDIVRQIKDVVGSRTVIVRIPFRLFWWLLRAYAVFDTDPPFTTRQLEALVIPESFPLIDWPAMSDACQLHFRRRSKRPFGNRPTPGSSLEF